jgi:hypothetical protein
MQPAMAFQSVIALHVYIWQSATPTRPIYSWRGR